jgi:putative holliday junction resolvase
VRVLALDLGSKRVGVAVSDRSGILASPLTTIQRTGDRRAEHAAVAAVVSSEGASLVVVGLPLNMDGSSGPAARAAEAEAAELGAVLGQLGVTVELADERLTTVTADRVLRDQGRKGRERRQVVDRTAAAVLLQAWLDGPGGRRLRGDGSPGAPSGSVDR